MMVKAIVDRAVDSVLNQAPNIVPAPIQFTPVNTQGKLDCIMNGRCSAI